MEKATDTSHFASDDEISNHFRVLANEQKAFENKIKNSLIEVRDEVNQVRIVVDDQKLKNANLADIIKQQDKELSQVRKNLREERFLDDEIVSLVSEIQGKENVLNGKLEKLERCQLEQRIGTLHFRLLDMEQKQDEIFNVKQKKQKGARITSLSHHQDTFERDQRSLYAKRLDGEDDDADSFSSKSMLQKINSLQRTKKEEEFLELENPRILSQSQQDQGYGYSQTSRARHTQQDRYINYKPFF